MEENLTVQLRAPVEFDGERITELTMRELTVDEIIALQKAHGGKMVAEFDKHYFAVMCGVAPQVIGKLGDRDWRRLKLRYAETLGNDELEPETAE